MLYIVESLIGSIVEAFEGLTVFRKLRNTDGNRGIGFIFTLLKFIADIGYDIGSFVRQVGLGSLITNKQDKLDRKSVV